MAVLVKREAVLSIEAQELRAALAGVEKALDTIAQLRAEMQAAPKRTRVKRLQRTTGMGPSGDVPAPANDGAATTA